MKILVLITAVTALMASCASFGGGVQEVDPLVVCEHINTGNSEALSLSSVLPFVFDGEILESDTQVRTLWTGLVKAGYRADNPVLSEFRPVSPADAALFADTWEIKTYFKNLMIDGDRLARITSDKGPLTMVLRPQKGSGSLIVAFKEGE